MVKRLNTFCLDFYPNFNFDPNKLIEAAFFSTLKFDGYLIPFNDDDVVISISPDEVTTRDITSHHVT